MPLFSVRALFHNLIAVFINATFLGQALRLTADNTNDDMHGHVRDSYSMEHDSTTVNTACNFFPLDNEYLAQQIHEARQFSLASEERLCNAVQSVTDVIKSHVSGDIVETGCNKGGTSIAMTAVAWALDPDRKIYACDSFKGLPPTSNIDRQHDLAAAAAGYDKTSNAGRMNSTGGSMQVRANFDHVLGKTGRYELVEGWFDETLPHLHAQKIAVLRLDGDMYSSTFTALKHLYPKVSVGGRVIIDDYGAWPQCKAAVHDYFECVQNFDVKGILRQIDNTGVYFLKPSGIDALRPVEARSCKTVEKNSVP